MECQVFMTKGPLGFASFFDVRTMGLKDGEIITRFKRVDVPDRLAQTSGAILASEPPLAQPIHCAL
jgi:hypothetical protein